MSWKKGPTNRLAAETTPASPECANQTITLHKDLKSDSYPLPHSLASHPQTKERVVVSNTVHINSKEEASQIASSRRFNSSKPNFVRLAFSGIHSSGRSRGNPRHHTYQGTPTVSPRSIDMEVPVGSKKQASRPSGEVGSKPKSQPPAHPSTSRTSRRHRKTGSADLARSFDTGGNYQYPPSHISVNTNVSPMNDNNVTSIPPPQGGGHHRIRSWSESQPYPIMPGYGQYYSSTAYEGCPPQGAYAPSGTPMVPFLVDPQNGANMLPPYQSQYNGNARRKHKAGAGHRRAHSYSGAGNSPYGSLDIPPSGQPPRSNRAVEFSPRSEIMKLTASMRPPTIPQSPRPSPQASTLRMPPSPMQSSFRHSGAYQRSDDVRVSFSPGTPLLPGNGILVDGSGQNLGVYGMGGGNPLLSSSGRSSEGGGEAVFLAQKKKHRKSPSARRMHMRQRSAQLFMEEVKGIEQTPKCRDISFLLLFLFHLLGIVYLGNTYGYEALRYHDQDEDDESVTIIYRNVVYVACLSGIFAVTVSALTLLLMTAIARKIVQIGLFLTITLSFAWGTIGIGLSPKKVVPATGIIALALSVAYTFIVWDRIPFAAANLNAALSGIRANPGSVLLAFFFQFLALGWSIYYTLVVVGVYDAMAIGELNLGHRGKIAMYCALGVSYYWTFHVFLVRTCSWSCILDFRLCKN